jgi:prepilin-type N-terminal cleavage/methylation domain-containing protein
MTRDSGEQGFTLIELLVAMLLMAAVSMGFYEVMMSGARNSRTAESLAHVSGEARVGLNRLLRETREAMTLTDAAVDGNSYQIKADPDGDGAGSPYYLRFTRDGDELKMFQSLSAGGAAVDEAVLVTGITPQAGSTAIFSFSSHLLEYDANSDGTVTWLELDQAGCKPLLPPPGDCHSDLSAAEFPNLSRVAYAFDIRDGDAEGAFVGEANIRAAWRGP